MREMDMSLWGDFVLSEIVDIQRGTGYPLTTMVEGDTPLVSAKATDNSIAMRADVLSRFPAGTMTVTTDGSIGYATVQPEAFDIASNAVALVVDDRIDEDAKLFLCAAIRRSAERYDYGNKLNGERLTGLQLRLPQTLNGEPDWGEMGRIMSEVTGFARDRIDELQQVEAGRTEIDTEDWGEFVIGDVFEVNDRGGKKSVPTGSLVSRSDLREGSTPRISVTGENNGVCGVFDSDANGYKVFENFVSVSFLGTVFYQPGPASLEMKVHCLKPLDHQLTEFEGLFLAALIRSSIGQQVTYGDQISSSVLAGMAIRLPQTDHGEPDWDRMGEMMEQVMGQARRRIEEMA